MFHKLFNPHCAHCRVERLENNEGNRCKSCDTLHELLNQERASNRQLLQQIIILTSPKVEIAQPEVIIKEPLKTKTWLTERVRLEAEDKQRAQQLRDNLENQNKTTEELESELGINRANL